MLMTLVHPNVVLLIEDFMWGLNLVLVLEYLLTNFAQVIQESNEKPLREAKIKSWMLQILAKVVACHMVSNFSPGLETFKFAVVIDGFLKIIDFGHT